MMIIILYHIADIRIDIICYIALSSNASLATPHSQFNRRYSALTHTHTPHFRGRLLKHRLKCYSIITLSKKYDLMALLLSLADVEKISNKFYNSQSDTIFQTVACRSSSYLKARQSKTSIHGTVTHGK